MLISISKKLTFLAMPKAASTSIERVLQPHCDIIYTNNPRVKHMRYRRYQRFILPYIEASGFGPLQTTCLFREPTEWLFSWYRYRSRDKIRNKPQSTADMTFDEFVDRFIDQDPLVKDIGRSSNFVSGAEGRPEVDHIYRYDSLPAYVGFLENRFDKKLALERLNASPDRDFSLTGNNRAKLEQTLALEYEIYESAHQ